MTSLPRLPRSKSALLRWLAAVAVAVVAGWAGLNLDGVAHFTEARQAQKPEVSSLESLNANRQSGIWTTIEGRVKRTLADDNEGSRHQRFIVEDNAGNTVLVAHNIDLASRVPLANGDDLKLYGRYEWNAKGGVLHWTHRDPQGREPGGWIEHRGKRYH